MYLNNNLGCPVCYRSDSDSHPSSSPVMVLYRMSRTMDAQLILEDSACVLGALNLQALCEILARLSGDNSQPSTP